MAFSWKTGVKVAIAGAVLYGGYVAVNFGLGFYELATFYDTEKITENFRTSSAKFPHSVIKTSTPWEFKRAEQTIPQQYEYDGKTKDLDEFLELTGTTGLLVVKDDTILFEEYYQGEKDTDRHNMFSVTKSFVSALIGIAIEDGLIESIDDPITKYVPKLKGSGYDGVIIRDILTMSSGIRFTEDYGDLSSDVNRMSMAIATGGSLDDFATSLISEREPGTFNNYVSVDTHVLGMMLVNVTGKTLTDYLQEKIWQPIGMEHEGIWAIDGEGMEVAMGGMSVSLRDMARLGRLYLHEGNWNGERIVPAQWVKDSVTPSAPHLMAGFNNPGSDTPYGYGFQWWTPSKPRGDYMASGIYHQFIYVDPSTNIIIAKTSANKGFTNPENKMQKDETISAFQQIAKRLAADE
ncbi:serine hydrolase [Kordiimonas sp. SCSIO 12603]|uniref:serine hydrolase domain-containing protein n=1 Tax=Kordiimonas sp. SCSIO 12603 TaxID=2829596 RepID=UPI002106C365|nr:serine hydrolase [Kordiimonas sp. SCSIO 12603]UTW58372.1 serine hydrolase [Kordiimonas sp. SCSIO 12603]